MSLNTALAAASALGTLALSIALVTGAQRPESPAPIDVAPPELSPPLGSLEREQSVMRSSYCASCHPDLYAEHEQNTHGRAFTDDEVRLATGRFSQADCIICHTPRPIFETGIGQNPIRRHFDLEEGNTCMTCHWKEGVDYSRFVGGPECTSAFDPRVGEVEACASCHRNHGTPYQWEESPNGKVAGNLCIDCHMPEVERPIAVGGPVRRVKSHLFPASRSESQLRRAYRYDARVEGNEVVVTIENKGAGHNFPTELKQRSVESLVVVRDEGGAEVARSRMVFRDPYKRPYGLTLPVNTQIPSGETREHRVPIGVASGTVECELHFKLYYPIEDFHPDLARRLEVRGLVFDGVTPSRTPVETEPDVLVSTPEDISPEQASPANLVDYARPAIGAVEVEIPAGGAPEDVARLIDLFQFPVPQANAEARHRLVEIGAPAVPALVRALGSWDNKTWNQAMGVLEHIGAPAIPAVLAALEADELYVRLHAAELVARLGIPGEEAGPKLAAALARPNALDRSHAAAAIGASKYAPAKPELVRMVREDRDPDVVRAAARALVQLDAVDAIPEIRAALERFGWIETRRDLAEALARLGDASAVPVLLLGLEADDDLIRESSFESFFAVTGKHFGFEPLAPREERMEAVARLEAWWAKEGGPEALRQPMKVDAKTAAEVKKITEQFGGTDGSVAEGDDVVLRERLLEIGDQAVPGLALIGLKYPAGFSKKRAQVCEVLGEIRHRDAVPALLTTLRDPVIAVAAWGCDALRKIGDESALPAVQRYHHRLLSLASKGRVPPDAGSVDLLVAQAASACFALGDTRVESELVALLLSDDAPARRAAFAALSERYGLEIEYDPEAPPAERRAAVQRWQGRR